MFGSSMELVYTFWYLGCTLSANSSTDTEVMVRVRCGCYTFSQEALFLIANGTTYDTIWHVITEASLRFVWSVLVKEVDIRCIVHHLKVPNVAVALQLNDNSYTASICTIMFTVASRRDAQPTVSTVLLVHFHNHWQQHPLVSSLNIL